MTTPKALFAGAVLIALSILLSRGMPMANASGNGPFQMMHHSNQTANVGVFRMDTTTGEVSYCYMSAASELNCTRPVR